MSKKHARERYFIAVEGVVSIGSNGETQTERPTSVEMTKSFIFSRFIPKLVGQPNSINLLTRLAVSMTAPGGKSSSTIPAGFTYLGQFLDHDLTLDVTSLNPAGPTTPSQLLNGRTPILDLDSMYGMGPADEDSAQFYSDTAKLKTGKPAPTGNPDAEQDGFDLPRMHEDGGVELKDQRKARIPDRRNDENLAVAQVHAAFIRFHNQVVDDLIEQGVPSAGLFERARSIVVKHYQWMVLHDYLMAVLDKGVLEDVLKNGRKFFETYPIDPHATMPVEFSAAAFRLGHSMVREVYSWNRIFDNKDAASSGHLFRLFRFSGTSGTLSPTEAPPGSQQDMDEIEAHVGTFTSLPSVWVTDWRRLFDLPSTGVPGLEAPPKHFNHAMAIDTHLADPLKNLLAGSIDGVVPDLVLKRNLAFRNLARGRMLSLPSGQQMAKALGVQALTAKQIMDGNGGATFDPGLEMGKYSDELTQNTPLWFYVLREAEFNGNRLGKVGSRIVAETFHRAIEASPHSVLRDTGFKPTLGPGASTGRFSMADLLLYAFKSDPKLLNPLG
jgi:hypothetical protein